MAIEIKKITWMWIFCQESLKYTLLATGSGSYADFYYDKLDHVSKQFYCFGYCFLSIKYDQDFAHFWKVRQDWKPLPKEDLLRDSIRTILQKRAKIRFIILTVLLNLSLCAFIGVYLF